MNENFIIRSLAVLLVSAIFVLGANAQVIRTDASPTESVLKNLQFRNIGPAIMGGRIDDFAVVENQPNTFYVGTASGGVLKTTNNGITWEPVFDNQSVSTIGDVTVAPSDPNIVWVGSGEANNRQSSSWGDGVYKSMDGGKTWTNVGLKDSNHIGRIVIDPRDPNIVYVAAGGHLWGPNKERGLYKTTDGGKTWTNTLFIDDNTGFTDVAMDPESSQTLYAAAYERRRMPFGFNGGGSHSGLYKTTDGGANWTKLTNGLPAEGDTGRIGIDIYHRNPNVVYVLVENAKGGVFRSEDRGATWRKMSDTNPRPMYYSQVRVDPQNDQRIWLAGASMYVSEDGGKTFVTNVVTRIHGDFHGLWIDPNNSNHMLTGSDGGIHISWDRGKSWDYINTIPLGQFYEIGFDMRKPYNVCGGLQDNGSWCGPVQTPYIEGITNDDWFRVGGGDGFYAQIDPTDSNIVYSESQQGFVARVDLRTGEAKFIRPEAEEGAKAYQFDWNSPIVISPHNHNTIYFGGNRLFKSTNRGDDWTESEDLSTKTDRDKLPILGKLPDKDTLSRHDGQETYGQIITISESPLKEGLLWVGTDDGNLQLSRDGGKTWKNLIDRVSGLPKNTYVSRVVASKYAEGTAYVTFDNHRNDDYAPYVFVTSDYGQTWRSLAGTLPARHTIHVIREHPRNQNLLLLGTEFGAFISWDRGERWTRLKGNLPTVPVDDIQIHPRENDLILATHGRSIWVLDDMTALEQLSEQALNSDLQVFDPRPATMYRFSNHKGNTGHKYFIAPNPPPAMIYYYLKNKPGDKDKVKVAILDKDGKNVLRELDGPKETGLNRVVWDLRLSFQPPGSETPAAGGGGGGFAFGRGPRVTPGQYLVRVSVGQTQASKTLQVEEDPRIQVSAADLKAEQNALLEANKLQRSAGKATQSLQALKTQLTAVQEALKKDQNVPEAITSATSALAKQLEEIQDKLIPRPVDGENAGPPLPGTPIPLTSRIGTLFFTMEGYTGAPSARQMEQIQILSKQLNTVIEQLNKIIEVDVPDLNKKMRESAIPYLNPGQKVIP